MKGGIRVYLLAKVGRCVDQEPTHTIGANGHRCLGGWARVRISRANSAARLAITVPLGKATPCPRAEDEHANHDFDLITSADEKRLVSPALLEVSTDIEIDLHANTNFLDDRTGPLFHRSSPLVCSHCYRRLWFTLDRAYFCAMKMFVSIANRKG